MKTDVQLQRDVLDELDWEPSVEAAQIGVTAHDGVVTLTGHVPVYAQKHTAEEVAKRVHGVRAVANEIQVRPTGTHVRDDEEIATAVLHAIQWSAELVEAQIQVAVEDGWVKLEGLVEQPYQRTAVEEAVRRMTGVRGVSNDIVAAPREMVRGIKTDIEAAFRRSAALNASRLAVEMDGACVILTGDVHSHSEREEAERIAWAAPGVQRVQDCITITPWGYGPADEWGY